MSDKKLELDGEIERIQVPDDDAYNWVKTLEEAGFNFDEIDKIMTHLNKTWCLAKKPQLVKERMENILNNMRSKYGLVLGEKDKESLKKQIEGNFVSDGKEIHVSSEYGAKSASYGDLGACIDHNAQVLLVQKLLSELARDAAKDH